MRKQDSFGLFNCPRLEAGRHKTRGSHHQHSVLSQSTSHTGEWREKYLLWQCLEVHIPKTRAQTKKQRDLGPRNRSNPLGTPKC